MGGHPLVMIFFEPISPEQIENIARNRLLDRELAPLEEIRNPVQKSLSIQWRVILKSILHHQFGIKYREWEIVGEKNRKPQARRIDDPAMEGGGIPIHFNASHTHGAGLLGISTKGDLGVDIENTERVVEHDLLARRFFPDQDRHDLNATPESQKKYEFIRRWTRLESILKLHGSGVAKLFSGEEKNELPRYYRETGEISLPSPYLAHVACPIPGVADSEVPSYMWTEKDFNEFPFD